MSLMALAYDTEDAAAAVVATRDTSGHCERGRHDDCTIARGPIEITAGPRAGRWLAPWICPCPCHLRPPAPTP